MLQIENIVSDRGSKYAVSGGLVTCRADVDDFLRDLKKAKRYAKATHNTWAVVLPETGPLKGDDGEAGAGMVLIRMLQRAELTGHIIVVTRWYGGKHLGGDRFQHVQTCARAYFDAL